MKKAIITGALILNATMGMATTTFAHSWHHYRYGYRHGRMFDYAAPNNTERGGPGPRVEGGSGTGAGAER